MRPRIRVGAVLLFSASSMSASLGQTSGKETDAILAADAAWLHPASKELLESKIPARLAYVWTDGTPRVVPIWFHWNEREFVLGTPPKAPKLKALAKNPKVALTIDDNNFPHKVLLVRGTARLQPVNGIVPEYALAAERYFGSEQGKAWVSQLASMIQDMVRITITPEWVGLLTFRHGSPAPCPCKQL